MKKRSETGNHRKIIIFVFVFFIILSLFFISRFIFLNYNNLSGKAVLELNVDYTEGEVLKGVLNFNLKEGELIPADSKLIVENAGQNYEYLLSDLAHEPTTEGSFYAEGKALSGSGEGYGVLGEKRVYPIISFELEIRNGANSEEEKKNKSEKLKKEKNNSENVSAEGETTNSENIPAISAENELSETPTENLQSEIPAESTDESAPESAEISEPQSETSTESTGESAPVEIPVLQNVLGLIRRVPNFFLGLTGRVSSEIAVTVDGETSYSNPFIYELSDGQTAEIVSSSEDVHLEITGNQAVVTTDYYGAESGFGEDYLGENANQISIDLNDLNLVPENGELKITLVYNSEDITSVSTVLGKSVQEESNIAEEFNLTAETNQTEINATQIETNETALNISESSGIVELTSEEKEVLNSEFGNASVELVNSKIANNRLVVKYQLGNYWIESSYDYEGKIDETLEILMERDIQLWLKDLSKKLSEEKLEQASVEGLVENYSF